MGTYSNLNKAKQQFFNISKINSTVVVVDKYKLIINKFYFILFLIINIKKRD